MFVTKLHQLHVIIFQLVTLIYCTHKDSKRTHRFFALKVVVDRQQIDTGFTVVDRYRAQWVTDRKRGAISFTKISLKKSVEYLLDKYYFKLGNRILTQIIGIPMGPYPNPFSGAQPRGKGGRSPPYFSSVALSRKHAFCDAML